MERENNQRSSLSRRTATFPNDKGIVLWEPTRGKRNRGNRVTYINCLKEGTGLTNTDKIRTAMMATNDWNDPVELALYLSKLSEHQYHLVYEHLLPYVKNLETVTESCSLKKNVLKFCKY